MNDDRYKRYGACEGAVCTGSATSSGAPEISDRNSLTAGANGPILLHYAHLLEQLAHFSREKVPERQPHARGAGAFGVFEASEDVSAHAHAALYQTARTSGEVRDYDRRIVVEFDGGNAL